MRKSRGCAPEGSAGAAPAPAATKGDEECCRPDDRNCPHLLPLPSPCAAAEGRLRRS